MKILCAILFLCTLYGVTGGNDYTDAVEEAREVERVRECVGLGGCDERD